MLVNPNFVCFRFDSGSARLGVEAFLVRQYQNFALTCQAVFSTFEPYFSPVFVFRSNDARFALIAATARFSSTHFLLFENACGAETSRI